MFSGAALLVPGERTGRLLLTATALGGGRRRFRRGAEVAAEALPESPGETAAGAGRLAGGVRQIRQPGVGKVRTLLGADVALPGALPQELRDEGVHLEAQIGHGLAGHSGVPACENHRPILRLAHREALEAVNLYLPALDAAGGAELSGDMVESFFDLDHVRLPFCVPCRVRFDWGARYRRSSRSIPRSNRHSTKDFSLTSGWQWRGHRGRPSANKNSASPFELFRRPAGQGVRWHGLCEMFSGGVSAGGQPLDFRSGLKTVWKAVMEFIEDNALT